MDSILDFHIWSLDGVESIFTLKICVNNEDHSIIKNKIEELAFNYNIADSTIEILDNKFR